MVRMCVEVIVDGGMYRGYLVSKEQNAHKVASIINSYGLLASAVISPKCFSGEGFTYEQILNDLKPYLQEQPENWWDK